MAVFAVNGRILIPLTALDSPRGLIRQQADLYPRMCKLLKNKCAPMEGHLERIEKIMKQRAYWVSRME